MEDCQKQVIGERSAIERAGSLRLACHPAKGTPALRVPRAENGRACHQPRPAVARTSFALRGARPRATKADLPRLRFSQLP